jgi:hypothetical protein
LSIDHWQFLHTFEATGWWIKDSSLDQPPRLREIRKHRDIYLISQRSHPCPGGAIELLNLTLKAGEQLFVLTGLATYVTVRNVTSSHNKKWSH